MYGRSGAKPLGAAVVEGGAAVVVSGAIVVVFGALVVVFGAIVVVVFGAAVVVVVLSATHTDANSTTAIMHKAAVRTKLIFFFRFLSR